ncbi:class II aldolase/adducin family protein [Biostraticola tofi]|uniref:Ribulose-5-phosphate 4-epimerase/fuculose-1-phosphate aldolase n=1 Tax=Biostraticola tofi TaxID=466109 RepID=A0A4V2W592_9GAMM|nr:class II aldolase/adducin family protein [Biostraticola tofi]TCV98874.1 ribulose-5-phosphate 4-epimerase/fuculose-1-phosphate aldolase [Biostraticola tofi]
MSELVLEPVSRRDVSAAEWQARIDLAAAHHFSVNNGFSQGIYNHLTLAVPDEQAFLLLPFGLHWSEATASLFLKVGYDGRLLAGKGQIQRSAYCIHAPLHAFTQQHAAVFHTHMPYASAIARLEDQRLLITGQAEALLSDDIAYDNDYQALARDPAEGERLVSLLQYKSILFMANHGVVVTGASAAEAWDRLYSLEYACQVQLYARWTGQPLRELTPALREKVRHQITRTPLHDGRSSDYLPGHQLHFNALKRLLDRDGVTYSD